MVDLRTARTQSAQKTAPTAQAMLRTLRKPLNYRKLNALIAQLASQSTSR